ncbi:putative zinc ribbon protein [Chitinophaga polysaccharea]|uniref:Putative zinc ribbon protein n=1 Tax=Chitinophaga polysaccharea TaxID=1293035 RepID=A0A561PRA2_9BACT|nr:zinc ribbon domain-containing protein [Chitinophaga polysaccharea]TWF40624.1 putative zinc ribbon protein [Chitinophaga polysaccharea]
MENNIICQSCSMPLDTAAIRGTEKDGAPSRDYCKYCYQHGEFIHPDWTLNDMKKHLTGIMEKEEMPEDILETAIGRLLHLKRWTNNNVNVDLHKQDGF